MPPAGCYPRWCVIMALIEKHRTKLKTHHARWQQRPERPLATNLTCKSWDEPLRFDQLLLRLSAQQTHFLRAQSIKTDLIGVDSLFDFFSLYFEQNWNLGRKKKWGRWLTLETNFTCTGMVILFNDNVWSWHLGKTVRVTWSCWNWQFTRLFKCAGVGSLGIGVRSRTQVSVRNFFLLRRTTSSISFVASCWPDRGLITQNTCDFCSAIAARKGSECSCFFSSRRGNC